MAPLKSIGIKGFGLNLEWLHCYFGLAQSREPGVRAEPSWSHEDQIYPGSDADLRTSRPNHCLGRSGSDFTPSWAAFGLVCLQM